MFPIAISNSPFLALVTVVIISGNDVPIAISTIVIIFSLIFSLVAKDVALSTIKSLLNVIKAKLTIKSNIAINGFSNFILTFSSTEVLSLFFINCNRYKTNIKNINISTTPSAREKSFGVAGLNVLSIIKIEKTVVISSNIGNSFFTVLCLSFIGLITQAKPIIKNTFTTQLPIILANAISPFLDAML